MYVHVGENVILKTEDIIGFLDVDTLKKYFIINENLLRKQVLLWDYLMHLQ